MKRVLFITYYWPPSGKASLHWPLKIIKYLPKHAWQPLVLTVEDDSFSEKDESLMEDISPELKVFKSKTYEPFNIYKKFIGKKEDEQLVTSETISKSDRSISHRISIWLRINYIAQNFHLAKNKFIHSRCKNWMVLSCCKSSTKIN